MTNVNFAGPRGLEPRRRVLETLMLPLHHEPNQGAIIAYLAPARKNLYPRVHVYARLPPAPHLEAG